MKRGVRPEFVSDPAAHGSNLLDIIISAGDNQIDDFRMNFAGLEVFQRIQHRLQASFRNIAIEVLREPLKINTGGIQIVTQII